MLALVEDHRAVRLRGTTEPQVPSICDDPVLEDEMHALRGTEEWSTRAGFDRECRGSAGLAGALRRRRRARRRDQRSVVAQRKHRRDVGRPSRGEPGGGADHQAQEQSCSHEGQGAPFDLATR